MEQAHKKRKKKSLDYEFMRSQMVQRKGKMQAGYYMDNKQIKDGKPDLETQNEANAKIWSTTIYKNRTDPKDSTNIKQYDKDEEKILREQQDFMRRHFLAQAVFGVQHGKQADGKDEKEDYQLIEDGTFEKNPGDNLSDKVKYSKEKSEKDKEEEPQPVEKGGVGGSSTLNLANKIENSKQGDKKDEKKDDPSTIETEDPGKIPVPNLATLASGGGRFNYRSTDGSGTEFHNFLMTGDKGKSLEAMGGAAQAPNSLNSFNKATYPMGTYVRKSTHGHSFEGGQIRETKELLGKPAVGFNFPISGKGTQVMPKGDAKKSFGDQRLEIGYQGKTVDPKGSDKILQTGAALITKGQENEKGMTMVAFEGSAPFMDNIHGGSHGIVETIKKVGTQKKSEFTLTGQDKKGKLGIADLKADVTKEGLKKLEDYYDKLKKIEADDPELEQEIYDMLLTSKTAEERKSILALIDELSAEQEYKEKVQKIREPDFEKGLKEIRYQYKGANTAKQSDTYFRKVLFGSNSEEESDGEEDTEEKTILGQVKTKEFKFKN